MLTRQEKTLLAALLLMAACAAAWLLYGRWQPGASVVVLDGAAADPPLVAAGQAAGDGEPAAVEKDQGQASVIVHVAGAVVKPGVYELPAGSRVVDALAAAGGPVAEAALDALNLAAAVVDGSRILVPTVEQVSGSEWSGAQVAAAEAGGQIPYRVHINSAGLAELQTIPGIGPALAARIVDFRQRNGPFRRAEDLLAVSGIGPRTLEQIQPYLVLP